MAVEAMNTLQIVYTPGTRPLEGIEEIRAYNSAPLKMGFDEYCVGYTSESSEEFVQDYPAYQHVIIRPGHWWKRGWTHDLAEYPSAGSPVVSLSYRGLRFLPFKNLFACWVLKHEFGHVRGLKHHSNPFCIMCPINVSFGRFCAECTRSLESSS